MKLILAPNEALTTMCRPVRFDELEDVKKVAAEMRKIMFSKAGLGLSANQVGDFRRFFVWKFGTVINPVIEVKIGSPRPVREGCLSFPGVYGDINRYARIKVRFTSGEFDEMQKELQGGPAQIFQHEIDHLNGRLIFGA